MTSTATDPKGLTILVNPIGLAPLLLGSMGILHEAPSQDDKNKGAYEEGTQLLWGVTAVSPFLGVRILYAVSIMMHMLNGTSNGFTRSEGAKVVLGEIPELGVVVVLLPDIIRARREG
ncbi:hypothetical protein SBOR_7780 [Sclerotinia borealis F-4128]|uniref:Uncharacterized protein n=1 Tax=Sclerotinia borealis (strain F-4128) TaxID=1432307 RepID=W9C7T7_SCLBF|nr:hypothetical protein SBOR_7780 [Sclerotinia borealis F-4128]